MQEQSSETTLGRPPKPAHLKRNNRIVIMVTDAEAEAIDAHVSQEGFADRTDFVRSLALEEVGYKRRAAAKHKGE